MPTSGWTVLRFALPAILAIATVGVPRAGDAQIPYNNPGPFAVPISAPGLPPPSAVKGKQYSHYLDQSVGGVADPAQIISWDGFGGTVDDGDYSSPAPPYAPNGVFQIDALANERDSLFNETLQEAAHLVYSVDHRATTTAAFGLLPFNVPSAGPITIFDSIKGGTNIIGGSGEISYELGKFGGLLPSNKHGLWASQVQINGLPTPVDVDALELWGSEPSEAKPPDANKYSVDTDSSTATANFAYSVWTYSLANGHTGYVPHSMVVDLVRNLLNAPNLTPEQIDLDALMVMDSDNGQGQGTGPNFFNAGDKILFSIRQIPSAAAPGGFFATGSEIFVLDGASTTASPSGGFLVHGGHAWDKAYALANMVAHFQGIDSPSIDVQLDLNALEAIAGIPEPATVVLLLVAALVAAGSRFGRPRCAR